MYFCTLCELKIALVKDALRYVCKLSMCILFISILYEFTVKYEMLLLLKGTYSTSVYFSSSLTSMHNIGKFNRVKL